MIMFSLSLSFSIPFSLPPLPLSFSIPLSLPPLPLSFPVFPSLPRRWPGTLNRRSSFLYQTDDSDSDQEKTTGSTKGISRTSSMSSHVGDETYITPFAQVNSLLCNFVDREKIYYWRFSSLCQIKNLDFLIVLYMYVYSVPMWCWMWVNCPSIN